METIDAIRLDPTAPLPYQVRFSAGSPARPLTAEQWDSLELRTLGGELLLHTAARYPFTWCVTHNASV